MKTNLLSLNLANSFNSRIKQYFLLLEVTNHTDLICEITDYLNMEELLNFISTSSYFLTLGKIQSIEIRILKAKLEFY